MSPFYKNLALWLVISLLMIFLFNMFNRPQENQQAVSYSEFLAAAEKGTVTAVTIQGNNISGRFVDGRAFRTFAPRDPEMITTA